MPPLFVVSAKSLSGRNILLPPSACVFKAFNNGSLASDIVMLAVVDLRVALRRGTFVVTHSLSSNKRRAEILIH